MNGNTFQFFSRNSRGSNFRAHDQKNVDGFEDLRKVIDMGEHNHKLGVCMDLCHVFSSGYDIKNLPFYIEITLDDEGHKEEIKMIRDMLSYN